MKSGKRHSRTWKSLATRAVYEIVPQFQLLPHIIVVAQYTETNADVVGVMPLSELEKPLQYVEKPCHSGGVQDRGKI